jgi:hypothetical protein
LKQIPFAPERGLVCCRLAAQLTPPPVWFFLDKIFAGRKVKIVKRHGLKQRSHFANG